MQPLQGLWPSLSRYNDNTDRVQLSPRKPRPQPRDVPRTRIETENVIDNMPENETKNMQKESSQKGFCSTLY